MKTTDRPRQPGQLQDAPKRSQNQPQNGPKQTHDSLIESTTANDTPRQTQDRSLRPTSKGPEMFLLTYISDIAFVPQSPRLASNRQVGTSCVKYDFHVALRIHKELLSKPPDCNNNHTIMLHSADPALPRTARWHRFQCASGESYRTACGWEAQAVLGKPL